MVESPETLRVSNYALRRYGKIQNIEDDEDPEVLYDPWAITDKMQETILGYIDDTPVDDEGYQKWLILNKYRQGGASTTTADAFYCVAQYTPGWQHITTADTRDRADGLFERVMYMHMRWPEELKQPMMPGTSAATRQLRWLSGSSMLIQAAGTKGVGVGKSAASWHWSEVPLMSNAGRQWSQLYPGIVQRKKAKLVMESTPFPMSEPSSAFYMEMCENARTGKGRFVYGFFPYWDGKLNQRKWPKGQRLENEEIKLLELYSRYGLTRDHLMFRRITMDDVPEIRRNPDLFGVFYPFDDITCWMIGSGGVIHNRHLQRHLTDLQEFDFTKGYKEFIKPKPGAIYVMGVDPSGYGARDHASFHVFEIWAGSWRQAAVYASRADPPEFVSKMIEVGRRYNWATINVERNGVGNGIIAALELADYPELYYEKEGKPGFHKVSEEQVLTRLIDALTEHFVLHDRDTVTQLRTYRGDAMLEISAKSEILRDDVGAGRRERHHWDKVSALMMVPFAAERMQQRVAPTATGITGQILSWNDMTLAEREAHEVRRRQFDKRIAQAKEGQGGRHRYRSLGRRGRGR